MLQNDFAEEASVDRHSRTNSRISPWKRAAIIAALLAAMVLISVCVMLYLGRVPEDGEGEGEVKPPEPAFVIPQTGMTEAVPWEYDEPAEHQGTIEELTYESWDYAGENTPVEKTAYVYLPYGYDPADYETRYDILYLMHVWQGSADEYFTVGSGMIINMIDHMIENGEIKPMIIVAGSFYNENSYYDFDSSTQELKADRKSVV